MEYRGSNVYDQGAFFTSYMKRRSRGDSPNNAIEGPLIVDLIGDVKNKFILDLGCGDASFGMELLKQGAGFYTGVDGSEKMVATAKHIVDKANAKIHHDTMESFQFPINDYDIVTSRFAIHYVSDINALFGNVHKALKFKGKFVFSVQHPLTTSSFISKQTGERRENWIVDDYFITGERKERWIGQIVVKYHRTIEQYFKALTYNGFSVVDIREGTPIRDNFSIEEEFKRRQRIPVVLAFSCVKCNSTLL